MCMALQIIDRIKKYSYQSLMWLIVYMSTMYQLSFAVVYPYFNFIQPSPLFMYMKHSIISWLPQVWGGLGLMLVLFLFIAIAIESEFLTKIAAVGQVVLWTFGTAMYVMSGYYFLAATVGVTMVLFWAWNLGGRPRENKWHHYPNRIEIRG